MLRCFTVIWLYILHYGIGKNIPYTVPKEGSVLVFSCDALNNDGIEWLLPQGIRIRNSTQLKQNNLQRLELRERQLIIHGIQVGMDGQYGCIQRNRTVALFFIPYIIANGNYTGSVILSLMVSMFFALASIIVLIISRYYSRRSRDIALVAPESLEMARKQNLITESSLN